MQTRAEGARIVGKLGFCSNHPMLDHFNFVKAHTARMREDDDPGAFGALQPYRPRCGQRTRLPFEQFFDELGRTYAKGVRAFADAGCRYLQLDEVFIAMLCDPGYRQTQVGRRR